jgi:TPR repeat protein
MIKKNGIMLLFVVVFAVFFGAVRAENQAKEKWLSTGMLLKIKSVQVVKAGTFDALELEYYTNRDIKDIDGLREEAECILLEFINDVERARYENAVISAYREKSRFIFWSTGVSCNFVFSKKDGKWTAPGDAKIEEFLEILQGKGMNKKAEGLEPIAESGNKAAVAELVHIYLLEKKYEEAKKLLRMLAAKNNPAAMVTLADLPPENKDKAWTLSMLRKAADIGYTGAIFMLGEEYLSGALGNKDLIKARKYFELAYSQGMAEAGGNLGMIYMQGLGVKKDLQKALSYTREAAKYGVPFAESNMAYMYLLGIGVKKDCDEAFRWVKMAVEQGSADGMDNLGSMYEIGCGVEKDREEALRWFKKSAESGCEGGRADYERLKKIMK